MEKWKKEMLEKNKRAQEETKRINNEILQIPNHLTDEEKLAYEEIVKTLKESINYRLSHSDAELIWQYCQKRIMRDRAWK